MMEDEQEQLNRRCREPENPQIRDLKKFVLKKYDAVKLRHQCLRSGDAFDSAMKNYVIPKTTVFENSTALISSKNCIGHYN